jgi:sugar phosphate isomerase/epimerase
MPYTRRQFTRLALAALPAAGLVPGLSALAGAQEKTSGARPNSKVNGVQIGLNVPYSFSNPTMSGTEILSRCQQLNLSAVELRAQPVEAFLGLPAILVATKGADAANAEKLRQWRKSAPLERVAEFRRTFEAGGVLIEILKVDNIYKLSPDELDYSFAMAKALGARAISTEISKTEDDLKRVGQFADKHKLMVGYHGHATTTPAHWEAAFSFAQFNGANVDLGHFVAGNNESPAAFIRKHHARITHVHVKDRKKQNGPNTPFGEGDTPIRDILRLIRDNRWNIQATIEFEYKVPAESDRMKELARAIQYCRDALA